VKVHDRERTKRGEFVLILFLLYISIVLYITVFRFGSHYAERQINLTIFRELINIYHKNGVGQFLWLFVGNIAWFIPFGFFLPMVLKSSSLAKTVTVGFLFSLVIEALQYVFYKGVAELDDLLLNTLGVVIGYFLFWIVSRYRHKHSKR